MKQQLSRLTHADRDRPEGLYSRSVSPDCRMFPLTPPGVFPLVNLWCRFESAEVVVHHPGYACTSVEANVDESHLDLRLCWDGPMPTVAVDGRDESDGCAHFYRSIELPFAIDAGAVVIDAHAGSVTIKLKKRALVVLAV